MTLLYNFQFWKNLFNMQTVLHSSGHAKVAWLKLPSKAFEGRPSGLCKDKEINQAREFISADYTDARSLLKSLIWADS
jgi:hypothetical protein